MAKIIKLIPFDNKRNNDPEGKGLETHPNNQKYWNKVIDGIEKLNNTEKKNIKK